jgi:hypothetical protein
MTIFTHLRTLQSVTGMRQLVPKRTGKSRLEKLAKPWVHEDFEVSLQHNPVRLVHKKAGV